MQKKTKIIGVMLLNASLVFGSMHMALASVSSVSDINAMDHAFTSKKNKPCKHASSTMHRVKLRTNKQSHQSMNHSVSLHAAHNGDGQEQHACDCPTLCADCCGDHGLFAAFLDVEFFQVIKQASSQPDTRFNYYSPISLPIETPPPVR